MKAVIQRVQRASVSSQKQTLAKIEKGLLILLGVANQDSQKDVLWLAQKIAQLRIFNDQKGVMNHSLLDIGNLGVIVVSQFTLCASTKKGNRPSYTKAAKPTVAQTLYELFVEQLSINIKRPVCTGKFGANMQVALINDGPVTIIIDTKNKE